MKICHKMMDYTRSISQMHPWSYNINEGESEWGLSFPDANGDCQSPLNINSREAEYKPSMNERQLSFSYSFCRETDVCNNGHTVVIYPKHKTAEMGYRPENTTRSVLSGGPLNPQYEYELVEFRFHWGREDTRGSEHTVNFKAFPMELHLIHWNCSKYSSLDEALGKPDGIAIVALFIQIGRENLGLKVIVEQLEDIMNKGRQRTFTTAFNPSCLLPDPTLRDFWSYHGSLTSPPCCENVTWIILRYPLTVSHQQIEEFRRLKTYKKGEKPIDGDGMMADNFRPTQPSNDRVIYASFES